MNEPVNPEVAILNAAMELPDAQRDAYPVMKCFQQMLCLRLDYLVECTLETQKDSTVVNTAAVISGIIVFLFMVVSL